MRLLSTLAAASLLAAAALHGEPSSLSTIKLQDIDGRETTLGAHAGKVLLLVNVASQCGYTAQYSGLEALWRKHREAGLVVIGVPSNDFGGQEPGEAAEIKQFCSSNYSVTFPLMAKVHARGAEQHPLFAALTGPTSPIPGPVKWNFNKFLIGRDGKLVARFGSDTEPDAAELDKAIAEALAAK